MNRCGLNHAEIKKRHHSTGNIESTTVMGILTKDLEGEAPTVEITNYVIEETNDG